VECPRGPGRAEQGYKTIGAKPARRAKQSFAGFGILGRDTGLCGLVFFFFEAQLDFDSNFSGLFFLLFFNFVLLYGLLGAREEVGEKVGAALVLLPMEVQCASQRCLE
jgi:hypothetical protein